MASSRRTGTNEHISTYDSGGGKDYSTLNGFEGDYDINHTRLAKFACSNFAGGPFTVGEALSFSNSGATGIYCQDDQASYLICDVDSGAPNTNDTISGDASSASCDIDTITFSGGGCPVLECYKGAHANNQTFSGATSNATYHYIIRPATGEGHSGIPLSDGSVVEFHATNVYGIIEVADDYVSVQDIVFKLSGDGAWIKCFSVYNGTYCESVGCLVYNFSSGSGNAIGFVNNIGGTNFRAINCLACNGNYGFRFDGPGYAYNCTADNMTAVGFSKAQNWKNCLTSNGIGFDAVSNGTNNVIDGTPSATNGAWGDTHENGKTTDGTEGSKLVDSSETFPNVVVGNIIKNTTDTTYTYVTSIAEAGSGKLGVNDDIFVNGEGYTVYKNLKGSPSYVNAGGDDYHLQAGDTIAKDQGSDLSGDGTFAFDDDIDGDTRSSTWDIGFDEYVAAGGISVPIAWHHLNKNIGR